MYKIEEYKVCQKASIIAFWLKIYVEEYKIKKWEKGINNTFIENKFLKLWVVLDEKREIIGTIALRSIEEKIEIKRMCVKKELRKQGIAKKLMEVVLDYIKDKNLKKIFLETYKQFDNAIAFYEKNGFERIGMLENNETIIYELK